MNGLRIICINTVDSQYERYDKVVNCSQITITYTNLYFLFLSRGVVNGLQKSKKDLRKENPVIAGGIFLFLFDDDFL